MTSKAVRVLQVVRKLSRPNGCNRRCGIIFNRGTWPRDRAARGIVARPILMPVVRPFSAEPPMPPPPEFPTREQLERFFFRTLVFFWDLTYWGFAWARKCFRQYVLNNPSVQAFVRRFSEGMEKARSEGKSLDKSEVKSEVKTEDKSEDKSEDKN